MGRGGGITQRQQRRRVGVRHSLEISSGVHGPSPRFHQASAVIPRFGGGSNRGRLPNRRMCSWR